MRRTGCFGFNKLVAVSGDAFRAFDGPSWYDKAMSASSIYLKHEITIKDLSERYGSDDRANLAAKWWFVGIDMAPNDNLETGVAVIDRNRNIVRMEKLNADEDLLLFVENLSRAENLIVALDLPKSLNISSKWRQQQIKMHPLRLQEPVPGEWPETVPTERYAQRAKAFYEALEARKILTLGFFAGHAKLRYDLNIPFRHRSPAGCRALQASLKQQLGIKELPTNLAPSSVLDALIASYTAWVSCHGKIDEHFKLYQDDEKHLYIDPLKCLKAEKKLSRRHRYRDRH